MNSLRDVLIWLHRHEANYDRYPDDADNITVSVRLCDIRCAIAAIRLSVPDAAYGTITNEDVREFHRKLDEEEKHLTPEKARESLIRSGVLDEHGRPRWPVSEARSK